VTEIYFEDYVLDATRETMGRTITEADIVLHAGQVQVDDELFPFAPRIHRHHRGAGHGAKHLLGQSVQLAELVSPHQHLNHLLWVGVVPGP